MTRFLLLLLSVPLFAAQLPSFEAENLSGKHVTIPAAAQGHTAVLLLGFTQSSSKETAEWAKKTKTLCETWSIAVLEDVPRLVRGMATHGIKGGTPKADYDHFLLLFQHEAELKQTTGFAKGDEAYVVLLAPDGSIRWQFHGPVTNEALAELRKQLE